MFVSINHIPVVPGRGADFEALWLQRDRSVEEQAGFLSVDVLRPGMILSMSDSPPKPQDNTYHVVTRWKSPQAFENWLRSESFIRSHRRERDATIFAGPAMVTTHETVEDAGAGATA